MHLFCDSLFGHLLTLRIIILFQASVIRTFERHLLAHLHETRMPTFSLDQLKQDDAFAEKVIKVVQEFILFSK